MLGLKESLKYSIAVYETVLDADQHGFKSKTKVDLGEQKGSMMQGLVKNNQALHMTTISFPCMIWKIVSQD